MSDLSEYAKEFAAVFANSNTNPTSTSPTQTVSPGAPAVVGTPGAPPIPDKPKVSAPRPVTPPTATPEAPTEMGNGADAKLEENAKAKLDQALANLKAPDANIGADFNTDFFNRLGSSAVPYTGLGKDFTRKTGVNDASHKDTLRYSRLVDKLNNRRYIGPAKGGTFDIIHGQGAVSSGNSAIGPGDIYKMDGLETAESRAQRRAEGYETAEREREISRKETVKDMPAALERLKQLAVLDQAGKLTDEQRAEQKQLFTAMLQNQYNLPYQLFQRRYDTDLAKSQQQYNTMMAMEIARYAAENGLTTQQYATQLGMTQAQYNTMLGLTTQQFATTLAEYIHRTTGIYIPMDQVNLLQSNPDYITSQWQASAMGLGAPDLSIYALGSALKQVGITRKEDITLERIAPVLEELQRLLGTTASDAHDNAAAAQR